MEQKTTWMRYLQIGIICSITLLFSACKKGKTSYERSPVFYIVNTTNYKIIFDTYPNTYSIDPNSTIRIAENQVVTGKKDNAFNYKSPYWRYNGPAIVIRFNGQKCLINQMEISEHSIININNFTAEKTDAYNYKFTYTFTEADYNRATTCP